MADKLRAAQQLQEAMAIYQEGMRLQEPQVQPMESDG
jgi:hypothetical protein